MTDEKLSIIIATQDRPEELRCLLESIAIQKVRPVQIVVVDGGRIPSEKVLGRFSGQLKIDYARKVPASLTAQRNLGIGLLCDEATLAAFFDDDIVLEGGCLELMMEFWKTTPLDVAGVALNNANNSYKKAGILEKIFLVGADKPGIILPSGFQSQFYPLGEITPVEWLAGYAMVYRKRIFNEFMFDEWFYGYAHCEDLDFGYRLSKKYKLFILRDARVMHGTKPIEKKYEYHLGMMQVINRAYFVKKNPDLSLILCYWSCLGLLLKNIFLGTLGCKSGYLFRGLGILTGIIVSFFRHKQVRERIKH